MPEYKPNYREIKSIATLEPGLKDVYVEGMSDYFLINDFLRYHKVKDVKVYAIDDIDFDELYVRMDPDKATFIETEVSIPRANLGVKKGDVVGIYTVGNKSASNFRILGVHV